MANNPKILDRVEDILGPNFVMWGSHMFCKLPRDGRPVPFHQDATYWPFDSSRTCTVWLAIDDADVENSAMRFVPGSHRHALPWVNTQLEDAVLGQEVLKPEKYGLRDEGIYNNSMPAGCISIHANLLIHGSSPNMSNRRRCGLTLRYCASDCCPLDGTAGRGGFFGGYVIPCQGDPGVWGEPGMFVHPPPEGQEDFSRLTGAQVKAAHFAAR